MIHAIRTFLAIPEEERKDLRAAINRLRRHGKITVEQWVMLRDQFGVPAVPVP